MKMRVTPERAELMYELLAARALEGGPAPTYAELAHAAGLKDAGGAIRGGLAQLEAAGRISVERRNRVSLRYRVHALGCWTGWGGKAPCTEPKRRRADYSAPAADSFGDLAPRKCMCCSRIFESEGIHNRLCKPCKGAAADASPLVTGGYGVVA